DKFERASEWVAETDRQLRVITRLVQPTESIQEIEADPTDDRILECAVSAEAEVIVSGDTHLLSLGSFRGIPIQRVAEFLGSLEDHGLRRKRSNPQTALMVIIGATKGRK
ncbi:MAG: PIN domain-containing protein, partial [Longimicrobiales bacterium]